MGSARVAARIALLSYGIAVASGCSLTGVAPGIAADPAWVVALAVMDERGDPFEVDPARRWMRVHHARHYPYDRLVETQVGPRQAESVGSVTELVEVELAPVTRRGAGVTDTEVRVRAWTESRVFAREVARESNDALAREVLDHLLADMADHVARERARTELAAARAASGVPEVEGMRLVPAGPFTRGDERGHDDERPVRTIHVGAFHIDATEVTVGQYRAFIAAGGYTTRACWTDEGWQWREALGISAPAEWKNGYRDALPVLGVSWYEAAAFARWAGKALPTEAQWEKAARWTVPSRYPWGPGRSELANGLEALRYGPVDAGGPAAPDASLTGCVHLAGNVAEWCRDWYAPDAYATGGDRDPTGPATGEHRVLRGGSFFSPPDGLRTAYRDRARPDERAVSFGFRLVREVGAP